MSVRRAVRQQWWCWALMGLIVVAAVGLGASTTPTEGVSDERLLSIAEQLSCQTCVGESVAASQSASAIQFREETRDQMARGSTDAEILNFFVDRYGQEVLLTPPASGVGALIWILPVVGVAAAVLLLASTFRRWRFEAATRHATLEDSERVEAALRARHDGS